MAKGRTRTRGDVRRLVNHTGSIRVNLKNLQNHWDAFGRSNAMGAILTDDSLAVPWHRQWDAGAFFQTGVAEIDGLMEYAATVPARFGRRRALDFGCGIGRLSQALAAHFSEVHGVDIAPSMIESARRFNRHGDSCHYHLNPACDLELFPDNHFDFTYSNIVLQHMEPRYSRKYIQEFIRTLVPGGLIVFQLPGEVVKASALRRLIRSRAPSDLLYRYRNAKGRLIDYFRGEPRIEMYGIDKPEIVRLIEDANGAVLDIQLQRDETASERWDHYQYCVTKHGEPSNTVV